MSWTVFPRIYTNLQSKGNFLRNEKSLPKYLIHEKLKMSAFFISEKQPQKWAKGRHFSITKLDILIFCNILHLEIDF